MVSRRLALVCALASLPACFSELGDIDRTQPNKLRKSVFQGDWYYRQTIIAVPYANGISFTGEQNDPTELIRWDVQEKFLIAYRAYDLVAGTDSPSVLPGDSPTNTPVAIFPIESHFDVRREYNPQTGEQTNVIVENTVDRPWYDRDYVRVDWSQNLSANFNFIIDAVTQQPGSHYVQLPGDPDALLLARKVDGRWEDHQGDSIGGLSDAQYLDVVHRIMVSPQTLLVEDWDGTIYEEPACWYYGSMDCLPGEVKVRSSFLRREPSSYLPRYFPDSEILRDADGNPIRVSYKDRDSLEPDPDGFIARAPYFDKFGYFRTERELYDRRHGETNSGRLLFINRFNIWEDTPGCVTSASATPYANCTVKPIVFYTSPNFPADVRDAAVLTAEEWNNAFKETVRALKYGDNRPLADVEDVFVLKDNTFRAEGNDVVDRGQRIGDLRYNFMYWVDEPTQEGLLGYGPSVNDPVTGETITASAFVYGAAVDVLAQRSREIIDLLNDPTRLTDMLEGQDVMRDVVARHTRDLDGRAATQRFIRGKVNTERQRALKSLGKNALKTDSARTRARLDALKDTPLESRLASDPVVRALSRGRDAADLTDAERARFSPRNWAMGRSWRMEQKRRAHLAKRKAEPTNFFDTSVVGIARAFKDEDPETVYQKLRVAIFRSTLEHEVGHTLGLRHNFEATTDALNYGRNYWDQRGENGQPMEPPTQAQLDGRMREYQYSSIMDYGSRFMSDITGLGLYDKAAIAFGYGDLVEVFDGLQTVDEPFLWLATLPDVLRYLRHYTKYPLMFGGLDGMHQRRLVPYAQLVDQLAGRADWTLLEVPYRFCSDEYDGASATCATYDEGADAYEIGLAAVSLYRDYLPFLAYSRDRRNFNEWDYMDRVYGRTLRPLLTMFQNWVWDQYNWEYAWDCARSDAGDCDDVDGADAAWFGMEDKTWAESGDAGLPGTAATRLFMDLLSEMVAMPEPGSYKFDAAEQVHVLNWYGEVDRCRPGQNRPDCADVIIPVGTGRATDSTWDFDSGYYFYDKLMMVGSFYDKMMALETAVTSDTYFLGVDTGSDVSRFLIGLSLYFPEDVYRLMGGASTEDYPSFAGVACDSDGSYQPPHMSGSAPAPCNGGTFQYVDPATSFTVELYAIWYAMAFLPSQFDTTFNDRIKIWLEGSGEAFTPADGALVATFTNPLNNRVYKATCVSVPGAYCPGVTILRRAQRFADAWTADPTDSNRWRMENLVSTIEDIRGTYDIYGYLYF